MGDRRRRRPAGDGDRQDRQGRRATTPGAHVTDAPAPAPAMGAPLDGIRVLDLSQVVSGPICGRMLADLGADVVKVEPGSGDIIRMLEPRVGDPPVSVYFTWANAGKRSISVDLREPRGAELVRQLAHDERCGAGELPSRGDGEVRSRRRHTARRAARARLLLGERVGARELVVTAAGVRRDGAGRGRPRRARRPPAECPARTESARRRRHHTGVGRGERSARGAVPARTHWARSAPRRVDWPRRSSTPTNGRRPSSRVTTETESRIPGTTRSSPSPTAPRRRSWAIRTGAFRRSRPRSRMYRLTTPTRATRRCGSSLISARRCPTSRRSKPASTPLDSSSARCGPWLSWPRHRGRRERGVFTEVEPGLRVAAAPFRSLQSLDRGTRPGAAVRRAHPRRARRTLATF